MKTYKLFAFLFVLLIGVVALTRPAPVYGASYGANPIPWLTNTNTSWVKDFLATHPDYKEEDIVKRDEYSIHFKRPDGKIEAEILQNPIHYKDDQGQWDTLDTAITSSDDSNYDYENITNSFKTYFSSNAYQENGNIKLVKGDAELTIKTIDKLTFTDRNETLTLSDLSPKTEEERQAKKGVVDEQEQNKICYPKLYEKEGKTMDVCYIVKEGRIQEQLILNQYQGFPELTQTITLTNAYAKKEGKQITFYHTKTNEFLWYILDPVIYEQNEREDPQTKMPTKFENRDLHYDLICNQPNTSLGNCSDLSITKILEPKAKDYLSDPQRRYPVTIDPDFTESTADGYVLGCNAAYATTRSTSFDSNIISGILMVGQRHSTNYYGYRAFVKFVTSAIPDTATVTQVNLTLACQFDYSTTDFIIEIVEQDWVSQDPLAAGTREAAYDGCLAPAEHVDWRSTSGMGADQVYTSGNLTTGYVKKTDAIPNTYYSLRSDRDKAATAPSLGGAEYINLHSQEAAFEAHHPILTVVYTTPLANGAACTLGSECTSTYCADSVCCDTACNTATCQICNSSSNAGAGTCGYISTAIDPGSECGAIDCDGGATKYYYGWTTNVCYYMLDVSAANAVCDGASLACKTAAVQCAASTQGLTSGVTRTACKTQVGCTGTTIGSLGNVADGSDTYSDCAANYVCNGAGACRIQDCASVPVSGNHSIAAACAFPGTVNGVDAGSGTTNTAVLTMGTGGSFTVLADQTIATGSLSLTGGAIIIVDGGSIKIGTPLYLPDVDGDGYPSAVTTTQYITTGANRARRATTTDCNDNDINKWQNLTGYADADGDGYGTGSSSPICSGASLPSGYAANATDCNDGNINVWQNLTGYADADGDAYTVAGSSQVCSGATLPSGYLASVSSPVDANDAQACPLNANPTGACNKCVTGAIANQTSSEDLFAECLDYTVVLNSASGLTCTQKCAAISSVNGLCSGAAACSSGTASTCLSVGTNPTIDDGARWTCVYNVAAESCRACTYTATGFTCATVVDVGCEPCCTIPAHYTYCKCD